MSILDKNALVVICCTDRLIGGEMKSCFEKVTEPYGIKLAYGHNPFLSTGLGSTLAETPSFFMRHSMNISPLIGMNDPNTRITPAVPPTQVLAGGVNVSVIGDNRLAVWALTDALVEEFKKCGSSITRRFFEPDEGHPVGDAVAQAMQEANIGIVIVRHLNAVRQMTVADFGTRISSPPVLQPGELK